MYPLSTDLTLYAAINFAPVLLSFSLRNEVIFPFSNVAVGRGRVHNGRVRKVTLYN